LWSRHRFSFFKQPGPESLHIRLVLARRRDSDDIALAQRQGAFRHHAEAAIGNRLPCQQHLPQRKAGTCLGKCERGA
jgi:hypothetical protein